MVKVLRKAKKLKNAIPKRYRSYYMQAGLADYSAEGIGVVLVQKPALDRMMSTFVGKPVVNENHVDEEPEELFNSDGPLSDFADGVVSEVGYDADKGWFFADLMVWDEETQENIEEHGYSVSCAYDVTEADPEGGTYHNVPYNEEILNGEYLHMAIVINPRYEDAYVVKNSLPGGKKVKKWKLFKNNKPLKNQEEEKPEPDKVENTAILNMEDKIQVGEEEMTVEDLINAAGFGEEEDLENAEDGMVTLPNGKEMKLSELINAYEEKQNMAPEDKDLENAEPAQDVDAEKVVDEALQNSNKTVKKNANFKKVEKVVKNSGGEIIPDINTKSDRLEKGKSRYGTAVAQGGK